MKVQWWLQANTGLSPPAPRLSLRCTVLSSLLFLSLLLLSKLPLCLQVSKLEAAVQSLASRGADELDETRRGYEERMHALRSELEQQEVDKAALLDIVQVHSSSSLDLGPSSLYSSCLFCLSCM